MIRIPRAPIASLCLASALALAGCNSQGPSEKQADTPPGRSATESAKGDPEVRAQVDEIMSELSDKQRTEIEAELAKLSPEDRALAESQMICYVSMAPLGSMEGATKVKVGEQEIMVCCEGCTHALVEHPEKFEKFLAHLKAVRPADADAGASGDDSEPVSAPKPDADKG